MFKLVRVGVRLVINKISMGARKFALHLGLIFRLNPIAVQKSRFVALTNIISRVIILAARKAVLLAPI